MLICFQLSMPNRNSWNGRWSGEDKIHARVVNLGRTLKAQELGKRILKPGSYYYNFGDGWGADVSVYEVDAKEATRIRRRSSGFCGYDWMIESIRRDQTITVPADRF